MRISLGVDEAGRGPLAGPVAIGVVAAQERFDVAHEIPGVADSKQLTEEKREEIFSILQKLSHAGKVRFTVRLGSQASIDRRGIVPTVRTAVWAGVRGLAPESSGTKVFLDGLLTAPPEYEQETIIRGDELVPLISLASIAAKVWRDRLMKRLAKRYPVYGFEQHKGYPTALHYAKLEEYGPCPIHRLSYLHVAQQAKTK